MEKKKYYTVKDMTEPFSLSRRTIYNYLKSGKLKGIKQGKSWYFTESEYKRFTEGGRV